MNMILQKPERIHMLSIDVDTIDYFKEQSKQSGIPYQTLINLYLADCVAQKKQLQMTWK